MIVQPGLAISVLTAWVWGCNAAGNCFRAHLVSLLCLCKVSYRKLKACSGPHLPLSRHLLTHDLRSSYCSGEDTQKGDRVTQAWWSQDADWFGEIRSVKGKLQVRKMKRWEAEYTRFKARAMPNERQGHFADWEALDGAMAGAGISGVIGCRAGRDVQSQCQQHQYLWCGPLCRSHHRHRTGCTAESKWPRRSHCWEERLLGLGQVNGAEMERDPACFLTLWALLVPPAVGKGSKANTAPGSCKYSRDRASLQVLHKEAKKDNLNNWGSKWDFRKDGWSKKKKKSTGSGGMRGRQFIQRNLCA